MGILSPELEAYLPRFIQIESGGNPNARTGSYSGLLQMGPDEIAKYGGNGLEQGKQLLADRAAELEKTLGRPPTPTELYMAHQQGMGGVQAHMANPDAPAWQNMAGTGEGRRKGEAWAKQAIWGNVPSDVRANYPGGVDSLTSKQFMDLWQQKVERIKPSPTAMAAMTAPPSMSQSPMGRVAESYAPPTMAAGYPSMGVPATGGLQSSGISAATPMPAFAPPELMAALGLPKKPSFKHLQRRA